MAAAQKIRLSTGYATCGVYQAGPQIGSIWAVRPPLGVARGIAGIGVASVMAASSVRLIFNRVGRAGGLGGAVPDPSIDAA